LLLVCGLFAVDDFFSSGILAPSYSLGYFYLIFLTYYCNALGAAIARAYVFID
jgi:hypothetical protein